MTQETRAGDAVSRKEAPPGPVRDLSLALIGLLFGAVLNTFNQMGCFRPWDAMVGTTLLCVLLAYSGEIPKSVYRNAAFGTIAGGAFAIVFGSLLDSFARYLLGLPEKGWCDDSVTKDILLAGAWAASAILVFYLRTFRRKF